MNRIRREILAAGLASLMVAVGCGPSEPEDSAPLDIRGKPIVDSALARAATNEITLVLTPRDPVAAVTTAPEVSALPPLEPDADGVIHVGFDVLAGYIYPETNEALPADAPPPPTRIPEPLLALNGRTVAVKGFVLPMKLQTGLATELLLMRDQSMCCFGVVPRINDWVSVKMTGRGVRPIQDQPVTIYGVFTAGEVYENGYLVTVYRLAGERMETALDL